MAASLRSFLAVDLSPDVRGLCKSITKRLAKITDEVKWVANDQLHLTLKFFGNVRQDDLAAICKAVGGAAIEFEPFDFFCGGVGAFPRVDRPRTIWLGVREGIEELRKLHAAIDDGLADIGYPRENRQYTPHITLGRVEDNARDLAPLIAELEKLAGADGGVSDVSELTLYSSTLTRQGPSHSVIAHLPLRD